jgi:hypothetical protein
MKLWSVCAICVLIGLTLGTHFSTPPLDRCRTVTRWLTQTKNPSCEDFLEFPTADAPPSTIHTAVDVFRWVGWRLDSTRFSKFQNTTLDNFLHTPAHHYGAFVIALPGDGALRRRESGEAFVTVSESFTNARALADALPLNALDAIATTIENRVLDGRRLYPFVIETAHFPMCASGRGACAVWEASSGRIVLHYDLAKRIIAMRGLPQLLEAFALQFAQFLSSPSTAASSDSRQGNVLGQAIPPQTDTSSTRNNVAGLISQAAAAALPLAFASQPLWWCFVCPIALGLLAPLAINFGLTAAAEQVCSALQLPTQDCNDLWWAAFAAAMVLSLASAVPIVYICHLPDCVKRRTAVNGTGTA